MICGPTAAGKSALALALAERYGATVISADSRQIYRAFDVGTAKPTAEERRRVPHRGVDLVAPTERYSAAEWAAAAAGWLAEAAAAGRPAVIVGGTGFYVRALTNPLFESPPLDAERRGALQRALAPLSTPELRRWAERLDPVRAHLGRAQLLRAVELALLTGVPLSAWHRQAARAPGVRARYLVVDPGASLPARIRQRVEDMVASGWEDEVRSLARWVPPDAPAWNATGYAAVRELVAGVVRRDVAVERIATDTWRYARRQRTWFRHQLPAPAVTPLDPSAPDAVERAARWWEETEAA